MKVPVPRVSSALAGTALATVGLTALATSAQATCPSGYHCVYKDTLDDGEIKEYFSADGNFTNDTFAGGVIVNDRTSAARNSSTANRRSRYYYDANGVNGVGVVFCVNPGSVAATLSSDGVAGNGSARNDEASSLDLPTGALTGCF